MANMQFEVLLPQRPIEVIAKFKLEADTILGQAVMP